MSGTAGHRGAGGAGELTAGGSLPAVWREHAGRHPQRHCLHDSSTGWISRGELAEMSAEVAVAGRPDAEWGELVVAHVVPEANEQAPTVGEFRNHVAERLAPYKHPRAVVPVEAIARNALGEVQHHLLGEVAAAP